MKLNSKVQKKKKHVTNSLWGGKKHTLVFDMLAAMVIAQTSVQQQHINPSWPSILTCDKRGGREGGGGAPLSTAPHFWVPGHQQALESPQSLGGLYSWRCRGEKKERVGKRKKEEEEHWVWKIMYGQGWRLVGTGRGEGRERSSTFTQIAKRTSCFWVFVCLSF